MAIIAGHYHLLENPLPGEWADKLLGRVVKYQETPTKVLAPDRDGPKGAQTETEKTSWIPQNIVKDLADEPMRYTTLHQLLSDTKDLDARASLTNYFRIQATRSRSTRVTIEGIDVDRYDISSIPTALKDLTENEDYFKSVKSLLSENGIQVLGMVTGIFVSKSLTITEERISETGLQGEATAPVSEAMGDPSGAADPGAALGYDHAHQNEGEIKIECKSVFAVAYTPVTLIPKVTEGQEDKAKSWKVWKRKSRKVLPNTEYEIIIDQSPGAKINMGDSSSSGSSSENDDEDNNATETRSATSTKVGTETAEEGSYTFETPDSIL